MPIGQPDEQGYDFGGLQFGQQQQGQVPQQTGGFGDINRTGPLSQLMGQIGGPSMNLQQLMQGNPMTGMQLPGMSFGEGEQGSLPGILKGLEDDTEPSILEHDEEFVQQQAQAKVMRTLGPMMQQGQMGGPQFTPPGGWNVPFEWENRSIEQQQFDQGNPFPQMDEWDEWNQQQLAPPPPPINPLNPPPLGFPGLPNPNAPGMKPPQGPPPLGLFQEVQPLASMMGGGEASGF